MQRDDLYATESGKSAGQFVKDFGEVAGKYGFVLHNRETMDMARTFKAHGEEVASGFDLHMVQLCKPAKAAKSLAANPERAVLMPKFIMVFSGSGKTQIRFLRFSPGDIRSIVDDEQFPGSLAETYERIVAMIDEAR